MHYAQIRRRKKYYKRDRLVRGIAQMNPFKKNRFMLLLGLIELFSHGCKKTTYQGIDSVPEFSRLSQDISCSEEASGQIEIKNSKTNSFLLSKSCGTDASSQKTPADIVFVIDITESMEDSLSAVKNGVERFANRLRQEKGWDARFAAIGFRDSIVAQTPFADEKKLTESIRVWEAEGGDDLPEAGQFALAASVEMLTRDHATTPERTTASKNIFFIGDAISYALNNDHKDFSTVRLERIFSSIPETLKSNLKFYHSSAREVEVCTRITFLGCIQSKLSEEYAAFKQLTEFSKKANLNGKAFDFPFTETIMLNEFLPAGTSRRRFAGTADIVARKTTQLAKAAAALHTPLALAS